MVEESKEIKKLREQAKLLGLRTGRARTHFAPNPKKKKKKKKKREQPKLPKPPKPPKRLRLSYDQLLKDVKWKIKRLIILKRDKYKCKNCGSNKHLNVHHLKYIGNPWDCPDEFLITLCEKCHKEAHNLNAS